MESKTILGLPIRWPERFDPSNAPIHVRNECFIPATSEVIWAWLVRATLWPTWYSNAKEVIISSGGENGRLVEGTRFHWHTFGVPINSVVKECVPQERMAWNAKGIGVDAYHAWVIYPVADGCYVLTEESQYGLGARLMSGMFPRRMYERHGHWLDGLRVQSIKGLPPQA